MSKSIFLSVVFILAKDYFDNITLIKYATYLKQKGFHKISYLIAFSFSFTTSIISLKVIW